MCTASDSHHEQLHRQRCQPGRQLLQLTSPRSTPFKDRELQAAQGPWLRPRASASPAPHPTWAQVCRCHFRYDLGQVNFPNRFLQLKYGNTCLTREELNEVMHRESAWRRVPLRSGSGGQWQGKGPSSGIRVLGSELEPPSPYLLGIFDLLNSASAPLV